jgi:hypothetical protein
MRDPDLREIAVEELGCAERDHLDEVETRFVRVHGAGIPVARPRARSGIPRRFVTSVPGSWACQLRACVARGPKIASASATPLRSVVVNWMMAVEIAIARGSRSIT